MDSFLSDDRLPLTFFSAVGNRILMVGKTFIDKSLWFSLRKSAQGMILATHHGPAIIRPPVWLLNVDFLAKDVIRALEVGWTFNKNLKTKSFVLVWSTLGEERASGPSNPVLSAISRSGFNENVLVMTWRNDEDVTPCSTWDWTGLRHMKKEKEKKLDFEHRSSASVWSSLLWAEIL